jgi:hypothetical protein
MGGVGGGTGSGTLAMGAGAQSSRGVRLPQAPSTSAHTAPSEWQRRFANTHLDSHARLRGATLHGSAGPVLLSLGNYVEASS